MFTVAVHPAIMGPEKKTDVDGPDTNQGSELKGGMEGSLLQVRTGLLKVKNSIICIKKTFLWFPNFPFGYLLISFQCPV